MRGALMLLGLAACNDAFGIDGIPTGSLAGFHHRKAVALTPALTSSLTSFPVHVSLPGDDDLVAAGTTSSKLAFTAGDGQTLLDHEIEEYDPETGTLDAWVLVPELGTDETDLFLYYGTLAPASDPHDVWTQFAAVWHMSSGESFEPDSTINHRDLIALSPAQLPRPAAGIAGAARTFDGVDDSLGEAAGGQSLDVGMQSFSFGVWVNATGHASEYDMPLFHGGSSAGNPGFDLELGSGTWTVNLSDGPNIQSGDILDTEQLSSWTALVVVIDRRTEKAIGYVNGISRFSFDISTLGSLTGTMETQVGGPYFFLGSIDEPRIYNTALSPEWIATEYANLATPTAMVSIGPAEDR